MKIRYAELFDALSIAKIHCETWQFAYANLIPQQILEKRKFSSERVLRWQNRIKEQKDIILVAENEQGIVTGFAWGGNARDKNISLKYELYALYVAPNAQGKGFGSALLKNFSQKLNEDFYLFALNGNSSAQNFYVKHGGILKPKLQKQQEDEGFVLKEDCFFFSAL